MLWIAHDRRARQSISQLLLSLIEQISRTFLGFIANLFPLLISPQP